MKMITFGSWSFPQAKGEWSFPLASLRGGRPVMAAAGVWDDLSDLVVLRPGLVQAKFVISSDVSWSDVDADLDDAKEALFTERALLGVATGTSGVASRQALARCVSLDVPFKYNKPRLALCTAKFELLQPHWDGVSVQNVNTSAAAFIVDNDTSTCATQRTLLIKIIGPLTSVFTLRNLDNEMEFEYDGVSSPVLALHRIEVHCGELTVLDVDILTGGTIDKWEYLSTGDNQIGFMALESEMGSHPGGNNFIQSPAQSLYLSWNWSYL